MSAYGPIQRVNQGNSPLPAKRWPIASGSDAKLYLTTYHLTLPAALQLEGLLEHLSSVFAKEVDEGLTYPQEGEMDRSTFEGYFFSADVFVGIIGKAWADREDVAQLDINSARAGRTWDECVAGFYYASHLTVPRLPAKALTVSID